MSLLKYGFNIKIVRLIARLSWPIIIAAKKWSSFPILRWIINPFFAYPWNEVTAIPINQEVRRPDNLVLPRRIVERIIREVKDIYIVEECPCRSRVGCKDYPHDIGCIGLGPGVLRMHPSVAHKATCEEAVNHVRRAADAGLIANVGHVWIDPVAFGLTRFGQLMFICFCDDCCCLYRTYMKKRGPNLDKAYKALPGIWIEVDPEKCVGCGTCVDGCFVGAMALCEGKAVPGENCKRCGRCVEVCPRGATSLHIDDENAIYERLVERIKAVADIW